MKKSVYLSIVCLVLAVVTAGAEPVKVACIGDSITYGSRIPDREHNSYPAQLGRLLGGGYAVRNYGVSGATLLKRGDKPYWDQKAYREALEWEPDIVVIKLGTNDTKPQNWRYRDEYSGDYLALIQSFRELATHPRVWVCLPVPAFPGRWGISEEVVRQGVIPAVRDIAEQSGAGLIDLYHPFVGRGELFPDTVHPNAEGAGLMAKLIGGVIGAEDRSGVSLNGSRGEWHGFVSYDFELAGRSCHVVLPDRLAAGRPWVWRARFWGHQPQTDLALLGQGYTLGYIDVSDLYGSPKAVAIWDRFYAFMVEEHHFGAKPALEGMSRGGLIVYNWAEAHPDRVGCIYADAPVCDIRSWPGGQGAGTRSERDWQQCLAAYGLTEQEAESYSGGPLANLAGLARAGVPLLHVCGGADKVVPPAENSAVLKSRYEALGGSIRMIVKPEVGHHPHSLVDPTVIVDFIMQHLSGSSLTIKDRALLGNSGLKFKQAQSGRVAFLGGSITEREGYRHYVCEALREMYPETEFDFINAGISSTCSTTGALRLGEHVLSRGKVDLLFVEFAVNDDQDGHHTATECVRGMEGIVRHALASNPQMDIVFLYSANEAHLADYQQGKTPLVIAAHEKVARAYGVSSINFAASVAARMQVGEFDWKRFGGVHPADFGNRLYADMIVSLLKKKAERAEADTPQEGLYPAVPLDAFSYTGGALAAVSEAAELEGFAVVKPDWQALKGGVRGRFSDIALLCGEKAGDSFSLAFEGKAIGLYVVAGPDAGMVDYQIDGGQWRQANLYHYYSANLHYPRTCMLATELAKGPHQLRVRIAQEKDARSLGHAARIIAFGVNQGE